MHLPNHICHFWSYLIFCTHFAILSGFAGIANTQLISGLLVPALLYILCF